MDGSGETVFWANSDSFGGLGNITTDGATIFSDSANFNPPLT